MLTRLNPPAPQVFGHGHWITLQENKCHDTQNSLGRRHTIDCRCLKTSNINDWRVNDAEITIVLKQGDNLLHRYLSVYSGFNQIVRATGRRVTSIQLLGPISLMFSLLLM